MSPPYAEKRNVLLLSGCVAIGTSSSALVVTCTAVAGTLVAPDPTLATAPLAVMFVVMMATTLPASFLMRRFGRRAGFATGALAGALGGALASLAMLWSDFALLCVGVGLTGVSMCFAQFYRFAAADVASPGFRPTAISLVMAGGVVAALLGPNLANWSKDVVGPVLFVGTYATLPALQAVVLVLLTGIRIPPPGPAERSGGRPLSEIARQPAFVTAVVGAVISYTGMNFVMVATPLAVMACGYGFGDVAFVLQWHVLCMYLPSFFTGRLITRFGAPQVMLAGSLLYLACIALNLAGTDLLWSFWPALMFLGLGWNFLFVGGTTLLTTTYQPSEKAKVQGFNDFLVFTAVAISALSSGSVHTVAGWGTVNLVLLALTAVAATVLLWFVLRHRSVAAVPT